MKSTWLRGWRAPLALAVVLLAILATLAFVLSGPGETGQAAAPQVAGETSAAVPSSVPRAPGTEAEGGAAVEGMPKADPVSIDVPKIEAKSSLIPLGLNPDNTVEVPPVTQPMQAGWYLNGPTPGEVGPSVILGHVDGNKQKGIFFRLKELAPGDKVSIARKDGTTAEFTVTKVERVAKDKFPTDAVYGDTTAPELRLITCGGFFDKASHNYLDNIIVFARLNAR
ncbi:class F sortase [Amycolatopsis regifaucium]|uniref:Class F sortase n=1 Tax=Amycolatopsis regifaucium TaxID=546365 RepID=A0A154MDE1_9PSEU|nr:class F sortase [Amycolatopsis regifaucium]KZB82604.1 peptidase C60 [Amycolatopsis regifaucium]OKA05682.1 class F sortase [Amycolatopsis regifaucium]SFG87441.1 Sortase family protein [Amycolatopsis regifaucium]